ncbi:MAG: tetraacyldisaccharide 4'-kinase [Burkholderiaceae bacterium]|nr:tetraacyldisaccharide 4'-kinase [Burkholderiaceae bacterium]MDO9088524.1 tetraacyldisaccharide 4'-kinase [Burkholderiaceae bacterium]MDP1968706.1 tetraacyldisaccharide 4'-kinase [Burkholderiaceae bacterium]
MPTGAQDMLLRAWTRRGLLAWLLWPLSLLYGVAFALRGMLCRWGFCKRWRAPVPVVVVGNVLAGGAGKTPVTLAVVQHLLARGLRVGVVSRGHGRRSRECRAVELQSSASEVGDEPLLIARRCGVPVYVARQRSAAVRALLAKHPDTQVIVSDDGLQHLALVHDISICVFDERGIGNGWLLPAGPLREPWPRAVDLVLHTGTTAAFEGFRATRTLDSLALRADGSRLTLASLVGRRVLALAGIARPQSFFEMLRAQGLQLAATLPLPDHHDFSAWRAPELAYDALLCTEKDAVKLWPLHPEALAVRLLLAPDPGFFAVLDRLLDTRLSSTNGQQTS